MLPLTESLLNGYVLGHGHRSAHKEKLEDIVSNLDWKIEIAEWAFESFVKGTRVVPVWGLAIVAGVDVHLDEPS